MAAIATEVPAGQLEDVITTLDMLNDDCIFHVCEYLPIYDLLQLSSVSTRYYRLTRRSLNYLLTIDDVEIQKSPLTFLIKLALFIRYLKFNSPFKVEITTVDGIFARVPNLSELSFRKCGERAFSKMFAQLETKAIETVLNGCYNLKEIVLGSDIKTDIPEISRVRYEAFFNVIFPNLRRFSIYCNQPGCNANLMKFLESNKNLRSLKLVTGRDVGISGILGLQLGELVLNCLYNSLPIMCSAIPNLFQLYNLRYLNLTIPPKRDIFGPFHESLGNFKLLKSLIFNAILEERTRGCYLDLEFPPSDFFGDKDLRWINGIRNLQFFQIEINPRHIDITLPGILEVIRNCPKLNHFGVNAFRRDALVYEEIYDKLLDISSAFYIVVKDIDPCWSKMYHANIQYMNQNHLDIFKRLL